jgi:3-methyladenine DNA glycosylase/8-oxoguanine DNA glycosylase
MTLHHKSLKYLAATDPVMSKLIKHIGSINLKPRRHPPFQSIIHAIIHQQLSGNVARAIFNRFVALSKNGKFPTPEEIINMDSETMRGAGLSRAKVIYVKSVADMALNGSIPSLKECDKLSDAELKERLIKIKGVGPWTVEMLLIFNLGRLDVLPIHDLGVRKGFQLAYKKRKLPTPEQLERFGRKWKPYRTIATLYLWGAADFINLNEW